jgi:MFS family permease
LSDFFDRRRVISATAIAAGCVTLLMSYFKPEGRDLFLMVGILGGFSLPIYSLIIAHTNDHLDPTEMLSASGTLLLLYGIGSVFGPFLAGSLMSRYGPHGFVLLLALLHLVLGLYGVYRMARREAIPLEDQGDFVGISPRASVVNATIAPQTALEEEDQELDALWFLSDVNHIGEEEETSY